MRRCTLTNIWLLRSYLPDGTPVTTPMEEERLRLHENISGEKAEAMAASEAKRSRELEIEIERLRTQLANGQNETPSD